MCGRHLAWAYPDHPPLVPVLSRLSEFLFGTAAWGLRLWPAPAGAGLVVFAGWFAARMGGGRFAQVVAALSLLLSPLFLLSNSMLQTVSFDQLLWLPRWGRV